MLLTSGKTPDQTKEQVIGMFSFCPALKEVVWMSPVIRHYCTIVPFHFHFHFRFHSIAKLCLLELHLRLVWLHLQICTNFLKLKCVHTQYC